MNTERIAALPMYDYPELAKAHDALWTAVADRLTSAGLREVPRHLTRGVSHLDIWRDPRLLLSQACEYPLANAFTDCARLVATPRYGAPGCGGAGYRSAIVVRSDDNAATLSDLRDRRCVVNETSSNSGMNFLRAAIAPLSRGGRFFESVVVSGSHRQSAERVATGLADVAALDCISFAHFQRLFPSALADIIADPAATLAREQLLLEDFDFEPAGDFTAVLNLERRAVELGYPELR